MAFYDSDDEVGDLEAYLRKIQGQPDDSGSDVPALTARQNYVEQNPPNYVDPVAAPPTPVPDDLGMAAPPPGQPEAPATPPTFNDFDPGKIGQKAISGVMQDTLDNPATPVPPAYNPTDLYADQAKYATPINPRDPQYRMGLGHRILGTVGNALNGFAGRGAPVTYVGPGATNYQYAQDVAAQQGNLAKTNAQIDSGMKRAEENRKAYQTQVQAQERGEIGKRNAAQAEKYTNAVDPNSIRYDEANDKWIGKTYGGAEQEVAEPKWSQQAKNKKAEDENIPAPGRRPVRQKDGTLAVMSKAGTMIPYTPKTLEEGAMLGDQTSKNLWYYMHRDKEKGGVNSADPNAESMSANEQRLYAARTSAINFQMQALKTGMGEAERDRAIGIHADTTSQAQQLYDLQKQKDAISEEIRTSRKGGKASSAAAPKPAPATNQPPVNPATKQPFKFLTKPNAHGQRMGSDDGQNWHPV